MSMALNLSTFNAFYIDYVIQSYNSKAGVAITYKQE